jgi:hypothetical protein
VLMVTVTPPEAVGTVLVVMVIAVAVPPDEDKLDMVVDGDMVAEVAVRDEAVEEEVAVSPLLLLVWVSESEEEE